LASLRLKIEKLGPQGDGIAQSRQGLVYLERTAIGDEVEARVKPDRNGILRGEPVFFHQRSSDRATPPCPHYDSCGNCMLQHLSLDVYRSWKFNKVVEAFESKRLLPLQWLPPVFLDGNNRRRATFSLAQQKGKKVMGYYSRRTQTITPIQECGIALPDLIQLKNSLEPLLFTLLKEGKTFDVFFQQASGQWEIVLIGIQTVPQVLLKEFFKRGSICRVSLKLKNGIQVLHETRPLIASFGPLKVSLPPASFLQPTQEGELSLVKAVLEHVPKGTKTADLFCGAGTFSGPLLTKGEVAGFESNRHAVTALRQAGKKYSLKVFERDLFSHPLRKSELNSFDVIVFDPPRAGCFEQAQQMAKSSVPYLIGVSCNPATFFRDAQCLIRGGYRLKSLQVFDQFLWSHHVEVIGVFTKKGR